MMDFYLFYLGRDRAHLGRITAEYPRTQTIDLGRRRARKTWPIDHESDENRPSRFDDDRDHSIRKPGGNLVYARYPKSSLKRA